MATGGAKGPTDEILAALQEFCKRENCIIAAPFSEENYKMQERWVRQNII